MATTGEFYYADNAGNGMPSKQHWFTREMKTLEKYYFNDTTNHVYYFEFISNDYQIRELTLSKDNCNWYNILLEEGTGKSPNIFKRIFW